MILRFRPHTPTIIKRYPVTVNLTALSHHNYIVALSTKHQFDYKQTLGDLHLFFSMKRGLKTKSIGVSEVRAIVLD